MQARCPRCAAIFTTDRSGLQFCPNCGQQVDVPSFPGAAPDASGAGWGGPSGPGGPGSFGPGPAAREDTPWERRATVGWLTGLWETWKRTLFSPQAFWASVKPNGSWTDALIYAWILFAVGLLLSAPFSSLGLGRWGYQAALEQMQQLPPNVREMMRNYGAGLGGLQLVFSGFLYPLGLIIYAALLHLFCMLFGVSKNGYYATFRVAAYASATNIVGMLPCLGFLAAIYGLVLTILGLASVQETTLGRAAAAVLAPVFLLFCCVCGAIVLAGAGLASILGQLQTQ
jgi:hypothetical protein